MPAIHLSHDRLDDERRGELIFAGDLVVFARVEGLAAFRERVDQLVRAAFEVSEPERAHHAYAPAEYAERMRTAQQDVRGDDRAKQLFASALVGTGVDQAATYSDWVHLRVQPPGTDHPSTATGWHRDTWASNVAAQTNWWTPIYPITAGRTITFAPAQWSTPVANSSAGWYPGAEQLIPVPTEPLEIADLPVVVEPGDLLCFSGAQLHGTVANRTDRARFSVEVRTVNIDDVRRGRGAPAIDGAADRTRYGWFRHLTDRTPLSQAVAD